MKQKIILFLIFVLVLSFYVPNFAKAETNTLTVDQQIQLLIAQIKSLQHQISNILLQRQTLADAYIVVNLEDNSIISDKYSNVVYSMASVTKLMNAVVSLENIDMDKTITLNEDMLAPAGYSPSLYLGLTVSARNLLKAALIQSTNDAAEALSYFVGNEKFIEVMNQKARDLGMTNTKYYDVHGLNPKNQSTASDLAKLVAYVYKNHPEIFTITKENDFWLPDPTGRLLKFKNVNNVYAYADFIGGKSGYIPEAKQTLASLAIIEGKPVAIVLLHSDNREKDAVGMVNWIKSNIQIN